MVFFLLLLPTVSALSLSLSHVCVYLLNSLNDCYLHLTLNYIYTRPGKLISQMRDTSHIVNFRSFELWITA